MPGFEKVFQRMDETIADVCLRELDWSQTAPSLWEPSSAAVGGMAEEDLTRARISEVYRLGRPLILHLIKMDKSPVKNLKKLSIARSMLDAGKKAMENGQPMDALSMFNKAVIFSPNIDDNLAKACAERAACLLQLGDYARALGDIEQAEQAEYQFERRFELDERKGLAYIGLGQYELAKASLTSAINLLDDAAGFLHKRFVERKMAELQSHLASCSAPSFSRQPEPIQQPFKAKFENMQKLADLRARNAKFPAFSEKVHVDNMAARSKRDGSRNLVAAGNIMAGDILGMEKPLASFLEKDFIKSNCWNCLVTLKAPYGCPLCSAVKFCSKACLREACSTYHPSECLLTDVIISNQISSWHLAYRAVSSRSLKQNLLVGRNGAADIYTSADLNNLFRFPLPPESVASRSEQEIKQRTVMTVFYLILLQMTGYFDGTTTDNNNNSSAVSNNNGGSGCGSTLTVRDDDASGGRQRRHSPSMASIYEMKGKENDSALSEAEMNVARLLDRIIRATTVCTTEVCHFEIDGGAEWTTGKVTSVIGKTVNPTLALISHSCYPSAARVCHENKTLLIAQKNLTPGEPITINYSAPFYAASRSDRQQYLTAGLIFNCECEACRDNWPLFEQLPCGPQALLDPPATVPDCLSPRAPMTDSPCINGQQALSPSAFRPVDPFARGAAPVTGMLSSSLLTQTEQNVMDTYQRVRGKLDQLQRSAGPRDPPTKIMIQNQVRLFRCLLAMYSSKLYLVKTGYGTLSIPV